MFNSLLKIHHGFLIYETMFRKLMIIRNVKNIQIMIHDTLFVLRLCWLQTLNTKCGHTLS
jgi:hypothetical protein